MNISDILNRYSIHGVCSLQRDEIVYLNSIPILYHDAVNDWLNDSKRSTDYIVIGTKNYGFPLREEIIEIQGFKLLPWKNSSNSYKDEFLEALPKILSQIICNVVSIDIVQLRSLKDKLIFRQFDISDFHLKYKIRIGQDGKKYYLHRDFWVLDKENVKRHFEINEDNFLSLLAKSELYSLTHVTTYESYIRRGQSINGNILMLDLHSGDGLAEDGFGRKYYSMLNGICSSMFQDDLVCVNVREKYKYLGQLLVDNIAGAFGLREISLKFKFGVDNIINNRLFNNFKFNEDGILIQI